MTQRRRAWLAEALIILALILLPLLFWWRLWALDPADRATIAPGDFDGQYYPLQLFAARELAAGRLPAWDPYLNAGQPGLADIQTGFYYPPNLLPNLGLALAGLPYTTGVLTAQVVAHFSLASLFTYLLVRHLARRAGARMPAARFAGAIAALAFTYGGYLTSFPVQQITILETTIWLPLVLFFVDRAFFRPRPLPQLVLAGVALACALLAGHPQTAMYVIYTVVAYGLFQVWSTRSGEREAGNPHILLRAAYYVGLPLIIAAALAAIQILPTLGFIARSTRAGLDYDAVAWGFPLAEITHLLYPGYFGGSPQYVGILPLILAAAALLVRRARREVIFWIVLGVVAFLLAFGGHAFLYNLAYLLAPGFGAVRNQERVIYLFAFAVSVLAGYGALILVQPLPKSQRRGFRCLVRGASGVLVLMAALTALWYFGYLQGQQQGVAVNLFEGVLRHHVLLLVILGGSVVLLCLRLSGRAGRGWLVALALVLVWLNLFTVNWRYNLADGAPGVEGPYPETGLVRFLQGQAGTFRVSSAGLLPGGASAGIVYELEDVTGNSPLRLDAFQRFEEQVGSWRLWQLLNVQYVLDQRDLDGPGLERVYEENGVKIYRMGDPLPRAWLVPDFVVAEGDQAYGYLNAEAFDPRVTAVLAPQDADAVAAGAGEPGGPVRVIEALPDKLVLDVPAGGGGLLVASQPYYPGWQADVDGERAPMVPVDTLLQGVPLEAGSHRVELTYHPSPLPALVTLAALLGCIVALVLARRRDR